MDVLSASRNDHKVAWYKNEGDGVMDEQFVIIDTHLRVNELVAVDFDLDGDVDVLSIGDTYSYLILHSNSGEGDFSEKSSILGPIDDHVKTLADDIDGDGDMDVVMVDEDGEHIFWAENTNTEVFEIHEIDAQREIVDILLIDMEQDGDKDIVVANNITGKIEMYENLGNGNFGSAEAISSETGEPSSLDLADLNKDGRLDIVFADMERHLVAWIPNEGEGNFGTEQLIRSGMSYANRVATGDLNGDNHIDVIATALTDSYIHYFLNDGTAGFDTYDKIPKSETSSEGLLAVDLNNDGTLDILWASPWANDKIMWHANDGSANFGEENTILENDSDCPILQIFDVDRDGDLDLLEGLHFYKNKGDGVFGDARKFIHEDYHYVPMIIFTDLDLDGYEDLLIRYEDDIIWHPGDIDGFETGTTIASISSEGLACIASADMDNDGKPDIVATDWESDDVLLYRNQGEGMFEEVQVTEENFDGVAGLKLTDINGDGHIDIMVESIHSPTLHWYANNGEGGFSEGMFITDEAYIWNEKFVIDLDLDQDIDIVVRAPENGGFVVIENDGNGQWSSPRLIFEEDANLILLEIADINEDGLLDLIYSGDDNKFRAVVQTEEGSFGDSFLIGHSLIQNAEAIDIDLDGDMDLIACSPWGYGLIWYENRIGDDVEYIYGKTYFDVNENGIRDEMELGLSVHPIHLKPTELTTFPNSNGDFSFFVPKGEYLLHPQIVGAWELTTVSSYNIDLWAEDSNELYEFGFAPLRAKAEVRTH